VKSNPVVKRNTEVNSDSPQAGEILDGPAKDGNKQLPLRALLTRPVVISVSNYCMIGLLDIMSGVLMPLMWSTSVQFGGLGMSPASIGLCIAGYGVLNGIVQLGAFPRIVRRIGPRRVFIASTLFFFPTFMLLPLENLFLVYSSRLATAILLVLQLIVTSFASMGFGAVFMFISSAAPNKQSLGATNGVAQMMVAIQRAIGPAAAASLFAFSLDNNILGGNFAYVVVLATVWIALAVAVQLPENMWKQEQ